MIQRNLEVGFRQEHTVFVKGWKLQMKSGKTQCSMNKWSEADKHTGKQITKHEI